MNQLEHQIINIIQTKGVDNTISVVDLLSESKLDFYDLNMLLDSMENKGIITAQNGVHLISGLLIMDTPIADILTNSKEHSTKTAALIS